MPAELENSNSTDEPGLSPINIDKLGDTVQADETHEPAIPVYMGQTRLGGTPQPDANVAPRRPVGLTIIAVLNFIGAVLYFASFLFSLFDDVPDSAALYIVPVQAALQVLIGVWLLQLNRWGRILALVLYTLTVILDVSYAFSGLIQPGTFVNLVVAVIVIWYLLRPQVAEAFQ
ncbi:MAG: hypothetical protein ABJA50_02310 [Chloroflexota bacterium]